MFYVDGESHTGIVGHIQIRKCNKYSNILSMKKPKKNENIYCCLIYINDNDDLDIVVVVVFFGNKEKKMFVVKKNMKHS